MRRVKTVYCIVVISVALILASVGDLLGIVTAIIVLAGAMPMFGAARRAFQRQFWQDVKTVIASSDEQHPKGPSSVRE